MRGQLPQRAISRVMRHMQIDPPARMLALRVWAASGTMRCSFRAREGVRVRMTLTKAPRIGYDSAAND
jgi:hypothetical protein